MVWPKSIPVANPTHPLITAMAMIVTAGADIKYVKCTQTALDTYMTFSLAEWHEIMRRPLRGGKQPWEHPALEIFDSREPISKKLRGWQEVLMAVIEECGKVDNRPRNILFPKVRGHILFYWIYLADNGMVKTNSIKPEHYTDIQYAMTQYLAEHPGFTF